MSLEATRQCTSARERDMPTARPSSVQNLQRPSRIQPNPVSGMHQRGVTLIELMVGVVIGLLVVAVAMAALMVSRGISGTVSDASTIQQQGAYAMRVIGKQLRQTSSLRLNLDPGTTKTESNYMIPVAFETSAPPIAGGLAYDPVNDSLKGTATPVTLTAGYRRYTEPVFVNNTTQEALSRNCLGGPADTNTDEILENVFSLNTSDNTLQCNGNRVGNQPLIRNVANFQVRYLLQDNTSNPGHPTIRSVDASGVGTNEWGQVQAIEVCLVLYGTEPIDLPANSTYTDCDGTAVDMSTLTGEQAKRMHLPFRGTFQLRSQGLIGSVL